MQSDLAKQAFNAAFGNSIGQIFQVLFSAMLTAASDDDKAKARERAKLGIMRARETLAICQQLCDELQ